MTRFALTLAALSLATACSASAKQVQVKGPQDEVVRLAGEWEGSYEGRDSGRVGTIEFDLGVGRHTADGQVYMYASKDKTGTPTKLQIRFIAVKGGEVHGRIAPYTDPRCNCQVETEFTGQLTGDVIDGTYVTKVAQASQSGRWSVYRKN